MQRVKYNIKEIRKKLIHHQKYSIARKCKECGCTIYRQKRLEAYTCRRCAISKNISFKYDISIVYENGREEKREPGLLSLIKPKKCLVCNKKCFESNKICNTCYDVCRQKNIKLCPKCGKRKDSYHSCKIKKCLRCGEKSYKIWLCEKCLQIYLSKRKHISKNGKCILCEEEKSNSSPTCEECSYLLFFLRCIRMYYKNRSASKYIGIIKNTLGTLSKFIDKNLKVYTHTDAIKDSNFLKTKGIIEEIGKQKYSNIYKKSVYKLNRLSMLDTDYIKLKRGKCKYEDF